MEIWITRSPDLETEKLQQLVRCVLTDLHDNGWRTKEFQEALELLAEWAAGEYPSHSHKADAVNTFKGYRCSICQERKASKHLETSTPLCSRCTGTW